MDQMMRKSAFFRTANFTFGSCATTAKARFKIFHSVSMPSSASTSRNVYLRTERISKLHGRSLELLREEDTKQIISFGSDLKVITWDLGTGAIPTIFRGRQAIRVPPGAGSCA